MASKKNIEKVTAVYNYRQALIAYAPYALKPSQTEAGKKAENAAETAYAQTYNEVCKQYALPINQIGREAIMSLCAPASMRVKRGEDPVLTIRVKSTATIAKVFRGLANVDYSTRVIAKAEMDPAEKEKAKQEREAQAQAPFALETMYTTALRQLKSCCDPSEYGHILYTMTKSASECPDQFPSEQVWLAQNPQIQVNVIDGDAEKDKPAA